MTEPNHNYDMAQSSLTHPYGKLVINKMDADTKEPLKGATFEVTNSKGEYVGTAGNGHYTTDVEGSITFDNLPPDTYVFTEIKAPTGYTIDQENNVKVVKIGYGETKEVDFYNQAYSTLVVKKLDTDTKEPIQGAEFKITNSDGTVIGNSNGIFTTNKDGLITIPNLPLGSYIVTETKAPNNYILADNSQIINMKGNATQTLTFYNTKKSSAQIIKIDSKTKQPLKGAEFKVYKANGELVGKFTTDGDGLIILPNLENGWYKAIESKAPNGYQIDDTAQDFEIKGNQFVKLVFENTQLGGLKIIKTNSTTGEPIAGVEFEITKMNGEKVLNQTNGTKFVTDSNGQVYLPNLSDGTYVVTETKQADGYFIDPSPKNVIVSAGKPTILEVKNTPASGLVIIKTDEKTGKPLKGVEFDILRADGSRVTSNILDNNQPNTQNNSPNKTVNGNGAVSGSYITDENGRIYLNHLAVGEYHIIETKALDGYELDKTVHSVTVREGKQETLEITNKKLSSILLRKIDADTKEGLMGARFILYNESGTPIGEFKSDNEGYVHIDRKLEDGKYYIEEVEAPKGYVVDNQRKTIYVQDGRTTSIVWENRLLAGQIQITKRSADYNDVTKLPAGSPLEGAVFEVYNTKNNVVDIITTDYRGVGASKGLPVGVYFVKEVQAPQYYALNDKEMWVEISHDGDIVKLDVLNKSLYLDVNVRKQGPTTINAGETLTYHITDVRNNSNTPLTNFIIHDQIPVGALRAEKIITGTFNERVNYSIKYKTNKSGEYKTLASNLLSKNSYEFSLHPNVLGLAKDEFVTDVKMEFPRVSSGFASLTSTKLNMYVLPTTASGYEITNKATAGGYAGTTFEHAISTWKTVVQKSIPKNPLPKTGY